ncbi:MAG TPA: sulfite exporter TauE/SafE family protein [Puia sp.]|nr:sulfite exporter TauE/SafE family protein [Puia sp.]
MISISIGMSLGLIGAGGSILTIPALVYILKIDPLTSSVYSMFIVGTSSLVGGIKSFSKNLVDFKIVTLFGIPSLVGVLIARNIIYPSIPAQLQLINNFTVSKSALFMFCIFVIMFYVGIKMLIKSKKDSTPEKSKDSKSILLPVQGLFIGTLTALLGIGGGFLIVPALFFWTNLSIKKTIGTTLLIIAINALVSFLVSYSKTILNWQFLLLFSAGSMIGMFLGIKTRDSITGIHLTKIFGWLVLSISLFIAYKEFSG